MTGTTVLRRFVHGPSADEPLVVYEGSGTTNKSWLHADERGSIIAATNASGVSSSSVKYRPDGDSGALSSAFGYTGQLYLPDLQLYYYKARMYAPKAGRFLQPDPIGYADGMNLYGYVGNDPVNRTDPSGLCWQLVPEFVWGVASNDDGAVEKRSPGTRLVWECMKALDWRGMAESDAFWGVVDMGIAGGVAAATGELEPAIGCAQVQAGNSLMWVAENGGDYAQGVGAIGLSVLALSLVPGAEPLAPYGFAMVGAAAEAGTISGGAQFLGGLLQGHGGSGYDNAYYAGFTMLGGWALKKMITGTRSVNVNTMTRSQRTAHNMLNRTSMATGGAWDLATAVSSTLAPHQHRCTGR